MHWNGGTAYALLQGKQLSVVKWSGAGLQKVFSRQFTENQDDVFPSGQGLGLCARGKRIITLLDQAGNMVKGFPLAGSTPFGICQIGSQKLVVTGNGSAVYSYKTAD